MATIFDFDLEALLAPISDDNPCGEDVYGENVWYDIKDYRGAARRAEVELDNWRLMQIDPNADDDDKGSTPPDPLSEWRKLEEAALEVTTQRSKNLTIVAHLIEALVRTDGFGGLLQGLQLVNGLVERYWDTLYPRPEPDEPAATVEALAQLNEGSGGGSLLAPLRQVPITNDPHGESYAYWQFLEAHSLETLPADTRASKIEKGAISLEEFRRSVSATAGDFFVAEMGHIQQALVELKRLSDLLDQHLSAEAKPSFSGIAEQLEDILRAIKTLAPTGSDSAVAGEGVVLADGTVQVAAGPRPGGMVVGQVQSREDAFKQLSLIADFFEKTEPLSLLSEQIRKTVRLGRMNPVEYFSELIEDEAIRRQMFKLVGIQPPE